MTIAAIALLASSAGVSRPAPSGTTPAPPVARAGLELQGVASCATSGCHHGNGPRGTKGSEYSTWLIHDPHARAYEVLLSERSAIIERNFRQLKSTRDAHAETDAVCLNCHVQPDALTAPHRPRFSLTDGVGCESCHGPAQKWLEPHSNWKALPTETRKQKYAENGMTWLQDLGTRARVCVTCHVGTPQADVNHDLIAAGHPRLNFEFASYQVHLPRHWDAKAEKARYPDFEARSWAIGQVACARASLELLAARSEKTWPEFAEYNCYACHKDLSPRAQRPPRDAVVGQAAWTNWPYALLPEALSFRPTEATPAIVAEIEDLRRIMRRPLPPPTAIAKQARTTADRLERWLDVSARVSYGDVAMLATMREKLQEQQQAAPADWDTSMQRYLGMAALFQAQRSLQREPLGPEFPKYLGELAKQLQVPGKEPPAPNEQRRR